MTKKQIDKQRKKLPTLPYTDELKQLENELDCREMINSILVYGNVDSDIDNIYNNKFLTDYRDTLSEDRIKKLIKEQQDDLKKSKIISDSYTDSEGVTYNSVDWYDANETDKQEESKHDLEFETIKELANYIADNYKVITGTELKDIFNKSDRGNFNTPMFNQEIIDKDWPKIEQFINKYGQYFEIDDLLDEIDNALIDKRLDLNLYESLEIDEEQIAKLYDYKEEDPEVNYDINPDDYNLKLAFDYEGDAETGPISDPVGPNLVGKLKDIYKYLDACGISRDDEDIEIYIESTEELDESKEIANYSTDSLKNIVDLFI